MTTNEDDNGQEIPRMVSTACC